MVVTIENASMDDVGIICSIYTHHVQHGLGTFEEVPPTEKEMLDRFIKITNQGFPFLLAKLDGKVIGYAYVGHFRERSAYRFTVENSIYISPECIAKGIGRQLLDALIAECKQKEYKQILAIIGSSNNCGSIKLHQSAGFEHVGIMRNVGYKFGQYVDVVIMQLALA